MASKRKLNDAVGIIKPKRSRDVLSISEKVKILDMIEVKKKSYAEIARLYGKNESSIREVMKNKEKIRASFSVAPQTAKVTAVARNKVLMKVEKALNLWVQDMNGKGIPVDGNVLRREALSLYQEFQKQAETAEEAKPFTASKGWLHRFRKRFNLKNIKIAGEATSVDKEGPTFPTELRKKIKEEDPPTPELKDKQFLPPFWKYIPKAWVTTVLLTELFHRCFVPEVKKHLEKEGLPLKVSPIVDNESDHSRPISIEDENDQKVFPSTNAASSFQPLDQSIVRCIKTLYTGQIFEIFRAAIDINPNVQNCWKSLTVADATSVKTVLNELKPEIDACWKNLCSEAFNDFRGFSGIEGEVKKIIETVKEAGGKGLVDMMNEHPEVLNEDPVESSTEEENEEEKEPTMWTLDKFDEVFRMARRLKQKIRNYDPMMERSVKITRMITEALRPLQKMFNEMKSQKQLSETMLFQEKKMSTIDDPQPSTSFASDVIQPSSFLSVQTSLLSEEDPDD